MPSAVIGDVLLHQHAVDDAKHCIRGKVGAIKLLPGTGSDA